MTHLSLFTGVGGFDLGFDLAGFETVAQVEADAHCRTVLAHHWPEVPRHDDIREFDGTAFRGVDVLTGGFPCQDLSVAGKRAGLAGARSGLFHELCRVVDEARPRLLVWENVPGLLSADGGGAMATVLGSLADLGYSGCWRVLDSQHFGVPQRRRRVFGAFAPGSAGGWACGAAVLLEREGGGWHPAAGGETGTDVARCLDGGSGGDSGKEQQRTFVPDLSYTVQAQWRKGSSQREAQTTLVANTLRAADGHHGHSSPRGDGCDNLVAFVLRQDPGGVGQGHNTNYVFYDRECQNDRILSPDGIAQPHRASASGGSDLVMPEGGGPVSVVNCNSTSEVSENIAMPLRANDGSGNRQAVGGVRRLTPLECERLQGFPPIEETMVMNIWHPSDHHRTCAPAASPSRKAPLCASAAGESGSAQSASLAAECLSTSPLVPALPVALSAHIDFERNAVEIRRAGKLIWSASGAVASSGYPLRMPPDDFAHLAALMLQTAERTTLHGRVGSHQSSGLSGALRNGGICVDLSGREIDELASDAEWFGATATRLLRSTTSQLGHDTERDDSTLTTYCSCVAAAMIGFIPTETLTGSSFALAVTTHRGWTNVDGTSDTQRYRQLGNAVTVNVAYWIGLRAAMALAARPHLAN